MATIKELLDYGKDMLEQSGNEYAKYDRKVLLEHVLSVNYMYMLMNGDEIVPGDKAEEYRRLIEKRAARYPLQYLTKTAYFMDYSFYVDENVLIPRSDTEILVETVNDVFIGNKILDLCCGSGCIGISLKLYHKEASLTLSDVSEKALSVARRNLDKYEFDDVKVNCGSLFEGIDEKYDVIVCNPPYIESDVIDTLMPEVKDYEPVLALDGGKDGLTFYKDIIKDVFMYLSNGGYMFFEIGYNQGKEVSRLMEEAGFLDVTVKKDYAGLDRVVYGHL